MPWKAAMGATSRPRSRADNKASIRGQISGPIPIAAPAPAPVPEHTDDELPVQHTGPMMAPLWNGNQHGLNDAAVGTRELENGQRQQQPPSDTPLIAPSHTEATGSEHQDEMGAFLDTAPSQSRPAAAQQPFPEPVTEPTRVQRQSAVTTDSDPTPAGDTQQEPPQRRKSVFRSALNRILGRKKKKKVSIASPGDSSGRPAASTQQHHRSDPIGESRPLKTIEPKRSTSLPITEYDRALRSHSIGPEDVLAIQSARTSLNAVDTKQPGKKAGAFDASRAHPAGPRWIEARKFTGLTPRPASSQDRRTRLADYSDDPNEIGRAITSDSRGLRRRSRSLSAFPSTDNTFHVAARRRSVEIRHWRESFDPAATSPLSSSAADVEDNGDPTAAETRTIVEERPRTPVQPFIFGDVSYMKEAAGLKITEAASLDSRISNLEVRMSRLEDAVTELGKGAPGFRSHIALPTREPPSVPVREPAATVLQPSGAVRAGGLDQSSPVCPPSTCHSDASKMAFGDATPRATPEPSNPSSKRPLSLATVRGATSLPSIPMGATTNATADHYMALMALLETERSAREALESQVRRLGHQLNLMSKPAEHARPAHGEVPWAGRPLGETSAFDDDDEDEDDPGRINGSERSRPSVGPDDSGFATSCRDDDECTEPFATPREVGSDVWACARAGSGSDISCPNNVSSEGFVINYPNNVPLAGSDIS